MDEKNPDERIGDAPGDNSDTTPNGQEKRKRDYDQVKEEAAPAREYPFSIPDHGH
jgi:hypothetical protein